MSTPCVASLLCKDYDRERVCASIEKLCTYCGGVSTFFRPGSRVLLKPNLIAPHPVSDGATTHPAVIEALIIIGKKAGALIHVGDSPAFGSARGVAEVCGIAAVCEKYDVPLVEFGSNVKTVRNHRYQRNPNIPQHLYRKAEKLSTVSHTVNEYDTIINVPKLKAHVQMLYSGAVKNLYGCISGKVKALRHFHVHNSVELFCLVLLEIYQRVLPELTIVDAIDVMEERGPRGGKVVRRGALFASADAIALDAVLARCMGCDPQRISLLMCAEAYQYGSIQEALSAVVGDDIFFKDFAMPSHLVPISFSMKTVVRSLLKHAHTLLNERFFRS